MLPDHGRQGQGASLPGPRSWITEGKPRQAMPARLGCRLMLPGAGQAAARQGAGGGGEGTPTIGNRMKGRRSSPNIAQSFRSCPVFSDANLAA